MKKLKVDLKRKSQLYPMPVVIVGSEFENTINWLTVAYVGIIGSNLISLSLSKNHFSNSLIKQSKQLSINIPSIEDVKKTDKVGCISGHNENKSDIFEIFRGSFRYAPMIKSFPINMECLIHQILDIDEQHELFICQPTNIYIKEGLSFDIKSFNPLLFSWEGYYSVGEKIGIPWKEN